MGRSHRRRYRYSASSAVGGYAAETGKGSSSARTIAQMKLWLFLDWLGSFARFSKAPPTTFSYECPPLSSPLIAPLELFDRRTFRGSLVSGPGISIRAFYQGSSCRVILRVSMFFLVFYYVAQAVRSKDLLRLAGLGTWDQYSRVSARSQDLGSAWRTLGELRAADPGIPCKALTASTYLAEGALVLHRSCSSRAIDGNFAMEASSRKVPGKLE
ncbi:hypothetical protein KM043_005693 [Ampulex compressa]|nr:hypothetical protein KM043_005693 [Ampulex compressa]